MPKLSDYDIWAKACEKCGFGPTRLGKSSEFRCWKCGNRLERDYSDRALKVNSVRRKQKIQEGNKDE